MVSKKNQGASKSKMQALLTETRATRSHQIGQVDVAKTTERENSRQNHSWEGAPPLPGRTTAPSSSGQAIIPREKPSTKISFTTVGSHMSKRHRQSNFRRSTSLYLPVQQIATKKKKRNGMPSSKRSGLSAYLQASSAQFGCSKCRYSSTGCAKCRQATHTVEASQPGRSSHVDEEVENHALEPVVVGAPVVAAPTITKKMLGCSKCRFAKSGCAKCRPTINDSTLLPAATVVASVAEAPQPKDDTTAVAGPSEQPRQVELVLADSVEPAKSLGCSKCRYSKTGCAKCRSMAETNDVADDDEEEETIPAPTATTIGKLGCSKCRYSKTGCSKCRTVVSTPAATEVTEEPPIKTRQKVAVAPEPRVAAPTAVVASLGCSKCRYSKAGCSKCRSIATQQALPAIVEQAHIVDAAAEMETRPSSPATQQVVRLVEEVEMTDAPLSKKAPKLGCSKCRYSKIGCGKCRARVPVASDHGTIVSDAVTSKAIPMTDADAGNNMQVEEEEQEVEADISLLEVAVVAPANNNKLGCSKCRYSKTGCAKCRSASSSSSSSSLINSDHPQQDAPAIKEAPVVANVVVITEAADVTTDAEAQLNLDANPPKRQRQLGCSKCRHSKNGCSRCKIMVAASQVSAPTEATAIQINEAEPQVQDEVKAATEPTTSTAGAAADAEKLDVVSREVNAQPELAPPVTRRRGVATVAAPNKGPEQRAVKEPVPAVMEQIRQERVTKRRLTQSPFNFSAPSSPADAEKAMQVMQTEGPLAINQPQQVSPIYQHKEQPGQQLDEQQLTNALFTLFSPPPLAAADFSHIAAASSLPSSSTRIAAGLNAMAITPAELFNTLGNNNSNIPDIEFLGGMSMELERSCDDALRKVSDLLEGFIDDSPPVAVRANARLFTPFSAGSGAGKGVGGISANVEDNANAELDYLADTLPQEQEQQQQQAEAQPVPIVVVSAVADPAPALVSVSGGISFVDPNQQQQQQRQDAVAKVPEVRRSRRRVRFALAASDKDDNGSGAAPSELKSQQQQQQQQAPTPLPVVTPAVISAVADAAVADLHNGLATTDSTTAQCTAVPVSDNRTGMPPPVARPTTANKSPISTTMAMIMGLNGGNNIVSNSNNLIKLGGPGFKIPHQPLRMGSPAFSTRPLHYHNTRRQQNHNQPQQQIYHQQQQQPTALYTFAAPDGTPCVSLAPPLTVSNNGGENGIKTTTTTTTAGGDTAGGDTASSLFDTLSPTSLGGDLGMVVIDRKLNHKHGLARRLREFTVGRQPPSPRLGLKADVHELREALLNARLTEKWVCHGETWARLDLSGVELCSEQGALIAAQHRLQHAMTEVVIGHGEGTAQQLLQQMETEWEHLKMMRQKYVSSHGEVEVDNNRVDGGNMTVETTNEVVGVFIGRSDSGSNEEVEAPAVAPPQLGTVESLESVVVVDGSGSAPPSQNKKQVKSILKKRHSASPALMIIHQKQQQQHQQHRQSMLNASCGFNILSGTGSGGSGEMSPYLMLNSVVGGGGSGGFNFDDSGAVAALPPLPYLQQQQQSMGVLGTPLTPSVDGIFAQQQQHQQQLQMTMPLQQQLSTGNMDIGVSNNNNNNNNNWPGSAQSRGVKMLQHAAQQWEERQLLSQRANGGSSRGTRLLKSLKEGEGM
jgi:hypothetical protein